MLLHSFCSYTQIPYLTVYAVLPSSFVAVASFTYLSSKLPRSRLFMLVVCSFAAFFLVFGFVMYPLRDVLIPHAFADRAALALPAGLTPAVAVIRNWIFALFYVCSELWGDVVLAFLFWGLANEITRLDEASQLYPLFGIGANIAQVVAGRVLKSLGTFFSTWELQLKALCVLCASAAALIIGVHHLIQLRASQNDWGKALQTDASASASDALKDHAKGSAGADSKASFWEAIKGLTQSVEIRSLATMAAAQGLASNVFQVSWKGQLRHVCPDPAQYSAFMGDVATTCGIATIVSMMVAPTLFDKLGWAGAASFTPRGMLGLGSTFFGGTLIAQWFGNGNAPPEFLFPMVVIGAALFVLERAGKFSFFKPAEEMVYICLSHEERTKGKAAVDIMGTQVGKAGGSMLLQCILLLVSGGVQRALPILWLSHVLVIVAWLGSIRTIDSKQSGTTSILKQGTEGYQTR